MKKSKEMQVQPEQDVRQETLLTPAVDVFENETELRLVVDLPGVEKKALELNIDSDQLALRAPRSLAAPGAVMGSELADGVYQRAFKLPQGLDIGEVDAELNDGVLTIALPKAKALQPRRIAIRG